MGVGVVGEGKKEHDRTKVQYPASTAKRGKMKTLLNSLFRYFL